jgi:Ca2+-transporting ATPase
LLTVSIIVSVIPEGLPVVITMSMAWGMQAMAKRRAVVRKLLAVETLGAVTVVATDKTGTLTYGEMMAQRVWVDGRTFTITGRGYSAEGQFTEGDRAVSAREEAGLDLALRIGILNNDSRFTVNAADQRQPVGDPTELALLVAGEKGGWTQNELETLHPRLGEIPFDAKYKHMVTWHTAGNEVLGTLKGAPAEVLEHCATMWTASGIQPLTPQRRATILSVFEDWAEDALRGLAVATAQWPTPPNMLNPDALGNEFTLVGLFGLADAVRPEVAQAVADMHEAGVRTMMLTGDHRKTGLAIAAQAGLVTTADGSNVLDGSEVDALSDADLSARLLTTNVATRLTPDHKLRIAQLLKASGEVVAMTGDGINDAPALLAADVGVAVGLTSSDAAKEASDVVLVDGNYSSIVAAITEGRRIYRNIRRAIVYLLASNFGELVLILLSLLFALPLPILPTHIIWLNAITDPFLGISLAREPISPMVMHEPPHNPRLPLLSRRVWQRIIISSLVLGLSSFFVFLYAHLSDRPSGEVFGLTLTTLAFGEWVLAMTVRSSIRSTFSLAVPNRSLLVSFIIVGLMQVGILYVPPLARLFQLAPLSLADWFIVVIGTAPVVLIEEVQKWRLRRQYGQHRLQ